MEDLLAIFMVFSVPLSAIGGFIYLRAKKMAMQSLNTEERQVLLELKAENAELRRRMQNLEVIVADPDESVLKLNKNNAEEITPEMLEQLAQKLRVKKNS
jgi:hypothetical protein